MYEFAYRETDKKAPFSVNSVYGDDVTSMFGLLLLCVCVFPDAPQ